MNCPLCLSEAAVQITEFTADSIVRLAWKKLRVCLTPPFDLSTRIRLMECEDCDLRYYYLQWVADESVYQQLQRYSWYYEIDKPEFQIARSYLPADAKVIEIGAGSGAFGKKLAAAHYVGLEINAPVSGSDLGLILTRETLEEHLLRVGPNQYDAACCFQVLEHIADLRSFVIAVGNAIRQGGLIVFSVPDDDSYLAIERNNVLNIPPHHQTRWRQDCFRTVAKVMGADIVACHREMLRTVHIEPYLGTMFAEVIDTMFSRQRRTIDPMYLLLPIRTLRKAFGAVLSGGLREPRMRPNGHSMTVILRKTSAATSP